MNCATETSRLEPGRPYGMVCLLMDVEWLSSCQGLSAAIVRETDG